MARLSLAMSRASLDAATSSEALSEASGSSLGSNSNSIAYLVYANRGDPYSAGYKSPTTRDIPQIKLPRVSHSSGVDIGSYLEQIKSLEEVQSAKDAGVHAADRNEDNDSEITPLTSIPEPFFSEDFQLDNPRVFDAVIGEEDSNMIQEKLSWYVDIVEAHLAREIARASTQFFAATAQFGAIEEQAVQTTQRIEEFSKVAAAQQLVVEHHLDTAELQRKLKDATGLCECLDILETLKTSVEKLELAIQQIEKGEPYQAGSFENCIHTLNETRSLASEESKVDLNRVVVAQPLLERIEIAENKLKSRAIARYVSAMLESLRVSRVKMSAPREGMELAQQQQVAEEEAAAQSASQSALSLVTSLNTLESAMSQYQSEVDIEVKLIIRKNVPSNAENSAEDNQMLARSLHAMSAEEADEMCQKLFTQLTSLFIALKEQNLPGTGTGILENAVKSADNRIARVLRVRKDPATTLDAPLFIKFYSQVTEFCDTCPLITDNSVQAVELGEFLVAQTKLYIHNLHALIETQLNSSMNSDDWRRAEITPQVQLAVDLIVSTAISDPDMWSLDVGSDSERGSKQRVELESQIFLISKSTTHLLVDLVVYLQLMCSLPSGHAVGIGFELVELLRMFNQKAHQQILGFGATKTAGLKHISVKNLVLCSESLRLVESLLVYIKKCVERHLPTQSSGDALLSQGILSATNTDRQQNPGTEILNSCDRVQQAYFDHRCEIHRKLVKLMNDKVSAYSQQISNTDWSQPAPQANKYMLDLVRQTTTVAHIAQEMLPPSLSLKLVEEIYAAYKPKLLEAYANVHVETVAEKRNVLRDLAFFRSKSEALKGAGNTGDVIYESVNGFVAPELTAEVSVPPSSRASLDLPRVSMDQSRISMDEADATLAYEPEDEEPATTSGDDKTGKYQTSEVQNEVQTNATDEVPQFETRDSSETSHGVASTKNDIKDTAISSTEDSAGVSVKETVDNDTRESTESKENTGQELNEAIDNVSKVNPHDFSREQSTEHSEELPKEEENVTQSVEGDSSETKHDAETDEPATNLTKEDASNVISPETDTQIESSNEEFEKKQEEEEEAKSETIGNLQEHPSENDVSEGPQEVLNDIRPPPNSQDLEEKTVSESSDKPADVAEHNVARSDVNSNTDLIKDETTESNGNSKQSEDSADQPESSQPLPVANAETGAEAGPSKKQQPSQPNKSKKNRGNKKKNKRR